MRRITHLIAGIALTCLLGACAGSSDRAISVNNIDVISSDSECRVSETNLSAGRTTFDVTNKGSRVTEVYVYGEEDGKYQKILSEVEDIGPGTSRDFTVIIPMGTFEVACKPGMKGDGIRQKIYVS